MMASSTVRPPLVLVYDDEFDILYAGYQGAGPSGAEDTDIPGLLVNTNDTGYTGFVVFDAKGRGDKENVLRNLRRYGFDEVQVRPFLG